MIYSEKRESSHSFNFVCCELREGGEDGGRKASVLCLTDSNSMNCTKNELRNHSDGC
jgi:hypothetical protein